MSRNPFLSTFEAEFNKEAQKTDRIDMSATLKDSPKRATFGPSTDELFVRPTPPRDRRHRRRAQLLTSPPLHRRT
jgi:hypothetical protein